MKQKKLITEDLEASLKSVGLSLKMGTPSIQDVRKSICLLADISPTEINAISHLFRMNAVLYEPVQPKSFLKWLLLPKTHREQLTRTPELSFLFLFHPDGHLREAALDSIHHGLESPFWIAVVISRMNDWVKPVRNAAKRCLERIFPLTQPRLIALTMLHLMRRQHDWARWSKEETAFLESWYTNITVMAEFASLFSEPTEGPLPSLFRIALRRPFLDRHLPLISVKAKNPFVRSIALETLAEGRARWRAGFDWQWIDKRYNVRRRIHQFEYRTLTISFESKEAVHLAVADSSPRVRKMILECADRGSISEELGLQSAQRLAEDPAKAVQYLAEFILRKTIRTQN